jgi:putative ABC transport system permease protein
MGDLLKIAFRNIFRNLRRSMLTIFISFLGVFVLMMSSSFLGGMFNNLMGESIKTTGHIRITSADYETKERMMSLTGNVADYEPLKETIAKVPGVVTVTGRLRFPSLVYKANGDENKEGLGFGIEKADLRKLNFKNHTYQGRPLVPDARDEIMVGRQLAESLRLKVGDEVTLLSRTLYNSTYALNYKIVGLFDMQNGKLNKTFYISLTSAQELLDMSGRVTEILVYGQSSDTAATVMERLKKISGFHELLLKRWDEIGFAPVFMGIVRVVSTIMQLVFILLAALGIANTMMMAVFERKGEIGLLKSMGMHEQEITMLFTMEGFFLGFIGTLLGLAGGGLVAFWLFKYGINLGSSLEGVPMVVANIIYGTFDMGIFIKALILGLTAAILASLLPALNGVRLKPTEALRKD